MAYKIDHHDIARACAESALAATVLSEELFGGKSLNDPRPQRIWEIALPLPDDSAALDLAGKFAVVIVRHYRKNGMPSSWIGRQSTPGMGRIVHDASNGTIWVSCDIHYDPLSRHARVSILWVTA